MPVVFQSSVSNPSLRQQRQDIFSDHQIFSSSANVFLVRFRRDLEAGIYSGPVVLEVGDLETTVRELEEKISQMESAGDQLAESMENAAVRDTSSFRVFSNSLSVTNMKIFLSFNYTCMVERGEMTVLILTIRWMEVK